MSPGGADRASPTGYPSSAWIYWVGPLAGTLCAVLACSLLAKRISVAKLYYFDSDPHRVFFRTGATPGG